MGVGGMFYTVYTVLSHRAPIHTSIFLRIGVTNLRASPPPVQEKEIKMDYYTKEMEKHKNIFFFF